MEFYSELIKYLLNKLHIIFDGLSKFCNQEADL